MENNNEDSIHKEKEDLLGEESYIENRFEYATRGQRFVNYIVDYLLMRYALNYATGLAIGTLIAVVAPEFYNELVFRESEYTAGIILLGVLIYIVNVTVYYTLCEKIFSGYTLGKLIYASHQSLKELNQILP